MPGGAPGTLVELLVRSVGVFGGRDALVTADERLTYAELDARVRRYSRSLIALGAGKGSRVGLLMENVPDWLALAFAVTGIGAVLVPLSTFSTAGDLAYQLRHADVSHLVLSERFLKHEFLADLVGIAPELQQSEPGRLYARRLPALRHVVVRGHGDRLPPGATSWPSFLAGADGVPDGLVDELRAEVDAQDECYLMYTSGTTANPKGVLQVHAAVAGNGWQIGERQQLDPEDVVWFYFPLFFSAGCVNVSLGTLSHGATLLLQPVFEPGAALELIEREQATTWHLWPHTLKALRGHPDWERRDHARLHKGTAPYDLLLGVKDPDGCGGVNMYGMTETCTAFTCTTAADPPDIRGRTQGSPLPGCELRIVDPDTGQPLPEGAEGEIRVKGPNVLRRYYKVDPATTFDADGFFPTGDLGVLRDDGRLVFLRRLKDTIKTGGINVSPAEVEEALRRIPGVAEAYAFGIPSVDRGEDVAAAVVPGSPLTDGEILTAARQLLSGPKRPCAVLLVAPGEVPMTGSGKVRVGVLRDRLLEHLSVGSARSAIGAPGGRNGM
jgi:fatty-acyl-CoA synthase